MLSRFLVPLLIAVALASTCGPQSYSSAITPAVADTAREEITAALAVDVADEVTLVLRVTNNTHRRLELNFPTGQTHDVVVLDSLGTSVWRWSEGRLFTQGLQNRMLDAGETVEYVERWNGPEDGGTYVAVATLTSSNHPHELRASFKLP